MLHVNNLIGFGAGGSSDLVDVTSQTLSDTQFDPDDATVSYELRSTGDEYTYTATGDPGTDVGDWVTPKANAGLYEARLTVNSGTTPSGALTATWLALTSTRTWTLARTSTGTVTCNCTIEVRLASDGVVKDSATIIMTATVSV